jgi:hypothetical protein
MTAHLREIATLGALVGVLLAALELGFRMGLRVASEEQAHGTSQVGAIQGALLGLLGLLLAFSFAAAGGRFLERQDLIVQEANAIGTATLRADLLDEPYSSSLRSALQRYTQVRLTASAQLPHGLDPGLMAEMERAQGEMWRAAADGVRARPTSMLAVLEPVNAVIDFHASRLAAGRKHIPLLVMGLLIACSILSIAVLGFGCGLGRRRSTVMTGSLALLIATSLWITIDLDHPRAGWIRLSDAPLQALKFDAP